MGNGANEQRRSTLSTIFASSILHMPTSWLAFYRVHENGNRFRPQNRRDYRPGDQVCYVRQKSMQHVKRLTKRRIALVQMEQSLNLLDAGDAVSALTLAGAAEEILGRIAARKGKEPRVGYLADYAGSLYEWAGKPRPSKKELIRLENRTRNHLKHQKDGRNVSVKADFTFDAEDMLLRCMFNHFNAFGCYPKSQRLRCWFENMTL